MSVINTNITSLIGQQNLQKSQSALATSMERLSSGLRINSAKDDAAGQAIANRMTSQITGLMQAQRNANDGISVAQTAEGALNQVNDNLQRIRELSVQAQNGTNSQDDLNSIQAEINQRLSEIDRISEQTDFNGVKVLSSDQELKIQVGANDGEAITVNLSEITSATLALDTFNVNGLVASELNAYADGDFVFENTATTTTVTTDVTTGAALTVNGTNEGFVAPTGTLTAANLVQDNDGNWWLKGEDTEGNTAYASVDVTVSGAAALEVNIADSTIVGERSADPLAALDEALAQVDTLRSDLGAIQNRFESAITNLQTNATNLSAARSRIEDADYAVEVANMTRAQILQQAGTSVLAQANQVPQSVLSLLG